MAKRRKSSKAGLAQQRLKASTPRFRKPKGAVAPEREPRITGRRGRKR